MWGVAAMIMHTAKAASRERQEHEMSSVGSRVVDKLGCMYKCSVLPAVLADLMQCRCINKACRLTWIAPRKSGQHGEDE